MEIQNSEDKTTERQMGSAFVYVYYFSLGQSFGTGTHRIIGIFSNLSSRRSDSHTLVTPFILPRLSSFVYQPISFPVTKHKIGTLNVKHETPKLKPSTQPPLVPLHLQSWRQRCCVWLYMSTLVIVLFINGKMIIIVRRWFGRVYEEGGSSEVSKHAKLKFRLCLLFRHYLRRRPTEFHRQVITNSG